MGSHPTLAHHQLAAEAPELDPDDWIHNHHRSAERNSEQAFDWLNPEFGVSADRSDRIGHRDVAQREAALSAYTFTCRLAYGLTCRSAEASAPVRLS
jgi:hypothetical protein